MTTLDKFMMGFAITFLIGTSSIALLGLHYNHVEAMADKNLELLKIQNMCMDN